MTHQSHRPTPIQLRHYLDDRAIGIVDRYELANIIDGYLLPEPTYRACVLDTLRAFRDKRASSAFVIAYDMMPQLEPQYFSTSTQLTTSRYYREVCATPNVSAISRKTANDFSSRRPTTIPEIRIDYPGVHRATNPDRRELFSNAFVMVGTVEPRKRVDVAIEAIQLVRKTNSDAMLQIFGRDGRHGSYLDKLERPADGVQWSREADDAAIASAIDGAAATVFISALEGYGLPPLESLGCGVPVITTGGIPALDAVDSEALIYVDDVSAAAVAEKMIHLLDADNQKSLKMAAAATVLPTWDSYSSGIADWIATTAE
jgi:glycosyltransferase involved in cell wall biosynthesis